MKYKSKFEERVHKRLPHTEYESIRLPYTIPAAEHKYTPDFVDENAKIIYEAKGRLTAQDRQKMLYVKEQNPDWQIVFVLMRPKQKINKNSNTSYGDWCERNGFQWMII